MIITQQFAARLAVSLFKTSQILAVSMVTELLDAWTWFLQCVTFTLNYAAKHVPLIFLQTNKMEMQNSFLTPTISVVCLSVSVSLMALLDTSFFFTDLCSQGDFPDTLEYKTVWGENRRLKCNELIDKDPSLCYNSVVQKYCCASCSAVELVKGMFYILSN